MGGHYHSVQYTTPFYPCHYAPAYVPRSTSIGSILGHVPVRSVGDRDLPIMEGMYSIMDNTSRTPLSIGSAGLILQLERKYPKSCNPWKIDPSLMFG